MTPEIQARILTIKQKMLDNTATIDELREGINLMREGRKHEVSSAARSSADGRRKQVKAEIKTADEMLDELGKI